MKATWEGAILAESDRTLVVEGNHYFPPDSVQRRYLSPSDKRTTCHWKGVASYYHVQVGEKFNADAAWSYPEPAQAAKSIKDYLAFWRGVQVSE